MIDALVYDIEIIKGIPSKKEQPVKDCQYCGGWDDHANMGVSVVGVFDMKSERARVFCEDNIGEFFKLCECRALLIGFNNIGFDNKVLNATWPDVYKMPEEENRYYDVLREIWIAAGLSLIFKPWTHGGFGLDAMCAANGIGSKSGHGALAPIQWQQGKIGSVIDYCLNDVEITRRLFEASQEGPVISAKDGRLLSLRKIDH